MQEARDKMRLNSQGAYHFRPKKQEIMSSIKQYAKGRRPLGIMNRLESKFAETLEEQKQNGDIVWWAYEPIRLRLADNTTYTPDFFVMTQDLELIVYETKGRWLDAARIKIKVAADLYPFRFVAAQWKNKQWVYEEF